MADFKCGNLLLLSKDYLYYMLNLLFSIYQYQIVDFFWRVRSSCEIKLTLKMSNFNTPPPGIKLSHE